MATVTKLPTKNFYIKEVTDTTPVYLVGNVFVAEINGVRGVVNWDGNNAYQSQLRLMHLVKVTAMRERRNNN